MQNLSLECIRAEAAAMKQRAERFYLAAAQRCSDAATQRLLADLADSEAAHHAAALPLENTHLTGAHASGEDMRARRQFILTCIQPALTGLMDRSVSTLARIFATAFASQSSETTFLIRLAASFGAGISMGFTEAASDDGAI